MASSGSIFRGRRAWFIIAWATFTVSLAVWWLIFGLQQNDRLRSSGLVHSNELIRFHTMLLWEGMTLVLSVLIGGGMLLWFVYKDYQRSNETKNFFLALTHDLKNSLASLLLKAELADEEIGQKSANIKPLVVQVERLSLHLENCLQFAVPIQPSKESNNKKTDLGQLIKRVSTRVSGVVTTILEPVTLAVDSRTLELIIQNILANARKHGNATKVNVDISRSSKFTTITFNNDGSGYDKEIEKLGKSPLVHSDSGNSGLGLFLVSQLMKVLNGQVRFEAMPSFKVHLDFPAKLEVRD